MSNSFPQKINEELELTYQTDEPFEYQFQPGYYLFELWGASGGGLSPGFGAYVSGVLPIKESVTLYLYIGQKGENGSYISFNGGGRGRVNGSSGGGATDLRLIKGHWNESDSLISRIIVAGGGGGSQITEQYLSSGGSAGIIKGDDGNKKKINNSDVHVAKGGEQMKGGERGTGYIGDVREGTNGGFGYGGDGSIRDINGNGGGGGYFGGGGSATADKVVDSGAGGSSFISGYDGCIAVLENSTSTNLYFSDNSLHYSSFVFNSRSVKNGSLIKWDNHGKIRIRCLKILNFPHTCKIIRLPNTLFFIYISFLK